MPMPVSQGPISQGYRELMLAQVSESPADYSDAHTVHEASQHQSMRTQVSNNLTDTGTTDTSSNAVENNEMLMSFRNAQLIGLVDVPVPTTFDELLKHKFYPTQGSKTHQAVIVGYVLKLRRNESLKIAEQQVTYDMMKTFHSLQEYPTDRENSIKFILDAIMGDCGGQPLPYAFPDPLPNLAAVTLAHIDDLLDYEVEEDNADESSPPPGPSSKKRKNPASAQTATPAQVQPLNRSSQAVATFMGNLDRTRSGYKLADKRLAVNCKVRGHNGLTIGQWWPFRACALRDGAHGASQAGIAGDQFGCQSIVINGTKGNSSKSLHPPKLTFPRGLRSPKHRQRVHNSVLRTQVSRKHLPNSRHHKFRDPRPRHLPGRGPPDPRPALWHGPPTPRSPGRNPLRRALQGRSQERVDQCEGREVLSVRACEGAGPGGH